MIERKRSAFITLSAAIDWAARLLLVAIPALLAGASAFAIPEHPLLGTFGLLVGSYFVVGILAPNALFRVLGGLAGAIQRRYASFIGPKIVAPLDAFVVGTGRLIEAIALLAWRIVLWLGGIALVLALLAIAIYAVANIPVSIAVIVGALIIAGVIRARR